MEDFAFVLDSEQMKTEDEMAARNMDENCGKEKESMVLHDIGDGKGTTTNDVLEDVTDNSGLPVEPEIVPTVGNVIVSVDLSCPLDLKKIYIYTRLSQYQPARFCGLVMRLLTPKTSALVFKSGKVVVLGAKSISDSYLAARKFGRIIQKIGFDVKFLSFKILNILGTCCLGFPIRLESLAQSHSQFSHYEPEIFAGLIYRMVNPKVILLIFVNGKVVITGAKSEQEMEEAFKAMLPVLKSFKKD